MRALALALLAATGAAAQTEWRAPVHHGLPVTDAVAPAAARLARPAPDCDPATEGARIEVDYTGFPAGAEAAFQAAVDVWACRVRSDQAIRVDARWVPLDAGTLGSAGPFLVRNFEGAPARGVWYPAALADALVGRDLGEGRADIESLFNSDFGSWHLGSGPAPEGRYDLTTVVLHELGHGLGLIGALTVEDGRGFVGRDPRGPYAYDLLAQDADGVALLDSGRYPDGSAALADALRGEPRFGGRAVGQAVGAPLVLYAPAPWAAGGSYSHLDEDTYALGTGDGLMTPFIARGEVIAAPGTAVCAMLADVGWTLAGDCAARVGDLPETSGRITATRRGPNPTRGRTVVRLSSPDAAVVRARVVDVLGRVALDLGTAVLPAGGFADVAVEGGALAAGAYVLWVTGGAEPLAVPLTVVR